MYRIGLVSDTHGLWESRIARIFEGVSHIIHAGDIGSDKILDRLEKVARVTAVKGNTDTGNLACCPEFTLVELGGLRIFVTHILGKSSGMRVDVSKAIHIMHPARPRGRAARGTRVRKPRERRSQTAQLPEDGGRSDRSRTRTDGELLRS